MNNLTAFRKFRRSQTPRVLASLVLAWLTFVVQPCVMAAPEHDSEPAISANHSGHALYDDQMSTNTSDTCPHCGDDVCVSTSGCDASAAVNSKGAASLADSGTAMFAVARNLWTDDAIQSRYTAFQYIPTPEALPRPVPLTVVHCVFLK